MSHVDDHLVGDSVAFGAFRAFVPHYARPYDPIHAQHANGEDSPAAAAEKERPLDEYESWHFYTH